MWVSRRVFELLTGQLSAQREGFERTSAVLREENTTLRRMLEASHRRAEELSLELTKAFAIGGVGPNGTLAARREPTAPRAQTSRDPIRGLGDIFAPVKLGDPDGTFKTEDEATLLFPSTNGDRGVEEPEHDASPGA